MGMLLRRHEAVNEPIFKKVEVNTEGVVETPETAVKTETKTKKKAKK